MATQYPIPAYTTQSLRDGLSVIRALYQSGHPMTAQDIMSATSLTHSRVERLLYTLEAERVSERDERFDLWSIHSKGLLWAITQKEEGA